MDSTTTSLLITALTAIKSLIGIPAIITILSLIAIVILTGIIVSYKSGKAFNFKLGPIKIGIGGKRESDTASADTPPPSPVSADTPAPVPTPEMAPMPDNSSKIFLPNDKLQQIIDLIKKKDADEDMKKLITFIASQIKDKQEEKITIKLKTTIERQMSAVEDTNIEIKSIIMEHYAKVLKTKNADADFQPKLNKDYRYYQMQISKILDDVKKNTIRESLKGTNIQSMDNVEFETFIDQKAKVIIMVMQEYLDLIHSVYNNVAVKMNETWLYDTKTVELVKEKIKDVYRRIKQIIIEDEEKIEEIDKKMESGIENMATMIPSTLKSIKELLNI